ncbi:hypothetical protein DXZ20_11845 [Leptolyngbyaceae cyanobacterium CCMR0081]|uniref:Uncharacterized protein n=1 Tax=Adonisia turfae CCMR0081 TaxID=2292702 RepID=A0A6M0RL19_9CYAN|nr:hypothetical protein [Adonisia turfae CCMR0081]
MSDPSLCLQPHVLTRILIWTIGGKANEMNPLLGAGRLELSSLPIPPNSNWHHATTQSSIGLETEIAKIRGRPAYRSYSPPLEPQ